MDKLKTWVVLTVTLAVAVLAAGWFLLISPKRTEAADLNVQADQLVSGNTSLRAQLAVLKAQAKDLPKQESKLAKVAAKIPADPALPALIRALTTISADSGVELVSLTPGPPTAAVTAPGSTVATVPGSTAATVPGSTVATVPGSTAPGVVTSGGGLNAIPVVLNVVGGYYQVQQFMSGIEDLPRALRVSNLTVTPGANPVAPKSTAASSASSATTATAATSDGSSLVTVITGQVFTSAPVTAANAAALATGVPGTPAPVAATAPATAAPAS